MAAFQNVPQRHPTLTFLSFPPPFLFLFLFFFSSVLVVFLQAQRAVCRGVQGCSAHTHFAHSSSALPESRAVAWPRQPSQATGSILVSAFDGKKRKVTKRHAHGLTIPPPPTSLTNFAGMCLTEPHLRTQVLIRSKLVDFLGSPFFFILFSAPQAAACLVKLLCDASVEVRGKAAAALAQFAASDLTFQTQARESGLVGSDA